MSVDALETLREKLGEVYDVRAAIALMHWDQETYMPKAGASARGRQLATLSALAHRLFTDDSLGRLINALDHESLKGDEALLVSETLHDFERATRLPEKFVERLAEEQSKAFMAWSEARAQSDFKRFQPHLETLVELLRQKADLYGYEDSPYDALLDEYERGTRTRDLKVLFEVLAREQSALVTRISERGHKRDFPWLNQEWDDTAQWLLTLKVLGDFGFDMTAGRQDRSVHPFSINFDVRDVRVTTRVNSAELFSALTGSMHECGHALYEQGLREADRRTTLGESISLGIHESQSRMWENMIGRSRAFWEYFTPHMRSAHPGKLDQVTAEELFHAINQVTPSFIRVEADECTYNLHVIIRFEIEVALIEGDLAVADVPDAWNSRVKQYLGLDVPNDALGCLQDIHWSHASIGYFPTYALGNLYAAQFFEKIEQDLPQLWDEIRTGNFASLLQWLRTHIHQVGRRRTAGQIVEDVTGRPLSSEPFLRYLNAKYGAIYGI